LHLAVAGSVHVFREVSAFPNRDAAQDATRARAPVAGKVTQVQVAVGDTVAPGPGAGLRGGDEDGDVAVGAGRRRVGALLVETNLSAGQCYEAP
jgi:hypothetical protein